MCGIIGYAGLVDGIDAETLTKCRDAIAHRGPDGSGLWISDDRRVALAHRRLAIVDLSQAGAQPMVSHNQQAVITFNGEIYNHSEIRSELRSRGWAFRGHSDTEVLLCAYIEWGVACLQRLRGMFAFAIYDNKKRSLFLARDRAGEKPLYWAKHRGGIMFASELKALLADPTFRRRIDLEGLDAYLTYGYVPNEGCLISGAAKLPPAHWLEFDIEGGSINQERYWDLPVHEAPMEASQESLTDKLHDLLLNAVREQLQADVPVAVLLSGGLDSSLVTAMAAKASSAPVRTYSVGFPNHAGYDERRYAREVARHFGTEHAELEVEQSSMSLFERLSAQYDEPIADSSMIPTYLLSEMVSRNCKVVLGGDAGDELFGGYRAYQGALALEKWRSYTPAALRYMVSLIAEAALAPGFPNRNGILGLRGEMRNGVARMGVMYDRRQRHKMVPFLQGLKRQDAALRWKRDATEEQRGVPGAYMAADFRTYLPEDILVKVDRASMASSLEVRTPFLDSRIIQFAFSEVPNSLRTSGSARKILLGGLAKRLLPKNFDITRKQGFSIPLSSWLPNPIRMSLCDRFEGEFGSYFNFPEIRRLIGGEYSGNVARAFGVLLLLQWMHTYNVSAE